MSDGLVIEALQARHGAVPVLRGVSLTVAPGEIVALLGRNGSGRTTLARTLLGLVPGTGSARWRGRELLGRPTHAIARLGVGYVPESRDVFPTLTVAQNLALGRQPGQPPGGFDDTAAFQLFPQLALRRAQPAGVLSGGEQQMLSLARTLMGEPSLLVVDEPTEGLAPALVDQVAACLRQRRERGVAVLLIEQKLDMALALADRCAVMGQGRVVFEGSLSRLLSDSTPRREWLEV
jgi:branched-chain amino acid transport system ATP-binding protein